VTHRNAIAAAAVLIVGVLGLGLVWTSTNTPSADASAAGLAPLTSGAGLTLQFSDRPMAVPALHLVDLEGQPVSMDQWRGKVVLLNFWATWCGPCRQEIPSLVALQEHYRDRLVVVGLSIDEGTPESVKAFARQFKVNYPVAMADDDLQRAFGGISSVPSTFVVDPQGEIVQRHVGMLDPRMTEHEVRALAGLPTDAHVERVKDTGQVLLANAAYATSIPGVDFAGMTADQKQTALERLNTEHCTCGCNLTLAQCRINDPTCDVSLPLAQKIAADVRQAR
jgi:thiol-disulfide isomerase/thioredoxin